MQTGEFKLPEFDKIYSRRGFITQEPAFWRGSLWGGYKGSKPESNTFREQHIRGSAAGLLIYSRGGGGGNIQEPANAGEPCSPKGLPGRFNSFVTDGGQRPQGKMKKARGNFSSRTKTPRRTSGSVLRRGSSL
jgi:hypothetical protein